MSYVLQRCRICRGVIDPDDDDFKELKDDPGLCSGCNEVVKGRDE